MPDSNEQWTVRRVLQWTIGHFRRHGIDTPRLDAELLLAHARGCRRIELYTEYDAPLSESERGTMRELVRRRAAGEPVAYLIGHREFYSLDFELTPDVLIPRPETETLVMEAIELLPAAEARRFLDVGTGSGCIAVALAVNRPELRGVAVDVSPDAIEVARRNAERHGVAEQIEFRAGGLFAPLRHDERFDLIASNPPYVADGEWDRLQPEIRLHEPRGALLAGPEGLDVIRPLIRDAAAHLSARGWLLIEIDPEQAGAVRALLDSSGYEDICTLPDMAGRPRVARARQPGSSA